MASSSTSRSGQSRSESGSAGSHQISEPSTPGMNTTGGVSSTGVGAHST